MSDAAGHARPPARPSPAGPSGARRLAWAAAGLAGLLAAAAYLAQFMTLAPWDPDAGLILGYVDQVAHGERPYFDFVDVYGPLNWVLPALFYRAYGEEVWGIRVLLLLLKLTSVVLTFEVVRRLARPFHAALAALWMTLLLGLPWPYLQTAFSFHQALPLILLTWLFLLARPLPRTSWNVAAASVAIAAAVWLKLNTGLFLFAAALLHCLCWLPADAARDGQRGAPGRNAFAAFQGVGIVLYAVVFAAFVREHLDRWFLLYLAAPLTLALLAAAAQVAASRRARAPIAGRLVAWASCLFGVLALSAVFALGYFGPGDVVAYATELVGILGALEYAHPLPALGEPGARVGFNEGYWLQLPWLLTAVYAFWCLAIALRPAASAAEHGRRETLHGLFLFTTLGSFVVYSRADENHVFQAVVPAVPALFVFAAGLEDVFSSGSARLRIGLRAGLAAVVLAWGSTIFFLPATSPAGGGAWSQPSMRLIHQRPHPHQRHPTPGPLLRRVDQATDEAARFIDEITEDGSEVLVLSRGELLNFLSHTRPAGGRYKYVLYLAKTGLVDREGLEALLPPEILETLVSDPPEVIVGALQESYLLNVLPELQRILDTRYHVAKRFGGILVFARNAGDGEAGG